MSHFTVLIIGDNPEEQLKPFDEGLKKDFEDYTEEVNKSWEEDTVGEWYPDVDATVTKEDYDKLQTEGVLELTDFPPDPFKDFKFVDGNRISIDYEFPEEVWKNTDHPRWSERIYAKLSNVNKDTTSRPNKILFASLEKIEPPKRISVRDYYDTFTKFLTDHHGYVAEGEKFGYWKNKDGKWDWFLLGGRWTGMLKLKEGTTGIVGKPGLQTEEAPAGYVDSAKKCDIDFEGMSKENIERHTKFYDEFLIRYEEDKECKKFSPQFEYGVKGKKEDGIFIPESKEEYVNRHSNFVTFAVIKDGKWYQRGEMGWFGIALNEKPDEVWDKEFSKLINDLPEETILSVYDCHS